MVSKLMAVLLLSNLVALPVEKIEKNCDITISNQYENVCEELHGEKIITCCNAEQESLDNIITYNFISNEKVKTISFDGSASLINYGEISDENIEVKIQPTQTDSEITLKFVTENDDEVFYNLYFSKDNNGKYYSTNLSLDVAKRRANKELNYNIVPAEEIDIDKNYLDNNPLSIDLGGSVSGFLKWTDDEGNVHPLINTKVKVTTVAGIFSWTGYTDSTGYYNISYSIGISKPTVHIYTDSDVINVSSQDGIYEKKYSFSENNGDFIYSYTFSPDYDGDMGKSMHLLQAGIYYANYIQELNDGNQIEKCGIRYPYDADENCKYNGNESIIYITSKAPELNTYPNSYAAWDVIGHEYGHHVQKYFGIADNIGGKHTPSRNSIDVQYDSIRDEEGHYKYSLEEAKDRGLRLSWAEGWPTFWSTIAQSTFPDEIKNIATVGDTKYTSYLELEYEIDSYGFTTRYKKIRDYMGDGDEIAITSILYKLYSQNNDSYDSFSISDKKLWSIIVNSKPHNFSQFVQALYNEGYNRYDLGKLLSKFAVSVGDLTILNNYLDECPTFTWSTYMGSYYLIYNSFDLVFLSPSGQEIFRKENLTPVAERSTSVNYTLTKSEWAQIIAVYGKKYYAYVVSRQIQGDITTGPYYSELFEFTEPDDFHRKTQIKPNEWGFEPQYFFTTNKDKQTSVPITDHGLTITHDRLRCGYIEDSYVILSPKRENAGEAYLEMQFNKPVYSYMFGITLWSSKEGLSSANCTAIVEVMDSNGKWHTDMDLFEDLPNGFSIRTQQVDRYETVCEKGIYGLKFHMTAPATGDRNKGRLCIDDIVLNTDPNDLWFISTFYE